LSSACVLVAGMGRGVNVRMPVVLVGALGGMAAAGIVGMFVGARLLALACQAFRRGSRSVTNNVLHPEPRPAAGVRRRHYSVPDRLPVDQQ
jgi:hypothetical protein